jgi:signal transduction histidine kinase
MRKTLHLIMLLLACTFVYGQSFRNKIDLQLDLINDSSDSLRFNAFKNLATYYNFMPNTTDSVNFYASKALDLAHQSGDQGWRATACYYKGLYHMRYSMEFDSALYYYGIVAEILEETGQKAKLSSVYNAIGATWDSKGKYEKAVEYYDKVLVLAKEEMDYVTMTNVTANLATLQVELRNMAKALELNKNALEYNSKDTSEDQINSFINVKLNMLDIFISTDSLILAERIIEELEDLVEKAGFPIYQERYLISKLKFFEQKKDLESLIEIAEQAYPRIVASPQINEHIYNSFSYYYAKSKLEHGDIKEVQRVIDDLVSRENPSTADFEANKYSFIYELSKEVGNLGLALQYLEKFDTLTDSLINLEKTERIQELLTKYEVEKKEGELKAAENDKLKLRRNATLLLAALMASLFIGSLSLLFSIRSRQKKKEEIYQIEQKMLALQMNPHFIFNAISSIQNYLFDEGDTKKALQHLSTFGNLMRQILENSREKFISLEDEIVFLTNYLNLQKLRYDERFNYEIIVDPSLDIENVSIPPLLLQPFVENAIEHADLHMMEDGKVIISITSDGDQVTIDIQDNGIGMKASQQKNLEASDKKSLAIKITKERLDLLNKLMKNSFSMNISSAKESRGTRVCLKIPMLYL